MFRSLSLLGMLVLSAASNLTRAQSLYVDCGDPVSLAGVPPATYGASLPPGAWNALAGMPAVSLLDTSGAPTGVSLSGTAAPSLDACGPAGPVGADGALYGDRWYFDPPAVDLTFTGLAGGNYEVRVHVLIGTCHDMFSPLSVTIAGASPVTATAFPGAWGGAPVAGGTYTRQTKTLTSGTPLVLQIEAPMGFFSYTQICGLQIVRLDSPTPFCAGDGSGVACPCGNTGATGRGCANSSFAAGAQLSSTGTPSIALDTVVLTATDIPGPALFFQSDGLSASALAFGDGLLCATTGIVRLGVVFPTAGVAAYPGGTTPNPVHVAGAPVVAGSTKHYQGWYRDAAAFCTTDTFNMTNGVSWTWQP